ncbi:MAG: uracil-DNA glycosylase [Bacteroidetes bacterium]|nr:uracil-DNA glycosylase [Bacteroidota bacterium]MBP6402491.1 uracil-DNA glycosylase [Bacteroidia bacterium]MBK6838807.1 uracil-DNA glycosylase [Bacteroidota bacterium]MBK9524723.1 uracil-DNA glycosylase [Bacteroidota bacterium]MBK9542893.1 uracil-DNA glycosylase [Bacteroidota bacterium]
MTEVNPKLEESWKKRLSEEFHSPYFKKLKDFLLEEKKRGEIVFPSGTKIFSAFEHTPFDKVKVVILGQDPYHGPGQAHGLSFSVPPGIGIPPSLLNMFKELKNDLGIPRPSTGNLEKWADQGVLLLNATLTVRANQPGSHQNQGWELFTDAVIREISASRTGVIFILWGKYAQAKEVLIDTTKHYILKSPHPSPFSADRGFFGCKHFSKTNEILASEGQKEIDWSLD